MRRFLLTALVLVILGAGIRAQYTTKSGQSPVSLQVVGFSSTPTFDASNGNVFKITLTGNVSSSSFINGAPAQVYTFIICQDSTGLRSFTWPTNIKGPVAIPTGTANTCSVQAAIYDGANGYAIATGLLNL
jgi:hypothetical protein